MTLLYLLGCGFAGGPDAEGPPTPKEPLPKLQLGKTTQVARPAPTGPPGTKVPEGPVEALTADMCDQLDHGGPVAGPDCITAEITCGETVVGHTIGGVDRFNSTFYEKAFCTPATTHDDGFERVYRLTIPPGDWKATVWLDTPCADLDVAAIEYNGKGCPTDDTMINRCDMWPAPWGVREKLELVSQNGTTWLLAVEGKNFEEGPFALHVECVPSVR